MNSRANSLAPQIPGSKYSDKTDSQICINTFQLQSMCVRSFKTTKVYFAMTLKKSCVKIWIASQRIYTNPVIPVSASTHHKRGGDVFWMQSQQELIYSEWKNIFSNSRTKMRPKNSKLSVPAIPVTNKILNGKAMCWVFCVCSEESSLRILLCQKYQLH